MLLHVPLSMIKIAGNLDSMLNDLGMLFVCGFGSSAVFGTFVGSWADQYGRRRFAALYCITYIISCMTKHFNSFPVLLIGRVTGGIATSLLSTWYAVVIA